MITIPQVAQYAAYLLLLIIAGGLEYFKLLPVGTVGGLFLLIVGHFFGNTPTVAALNQNTAAMKENTAGTTTNTLQAPQGPLHVVVHNETPPTPTAASAPPEPPTQRTQTIQADIPGVDTKGYVLGVPSGSAIQNMSEPQPIILPTPANQVPLVPLPDTPLHS